MIARSNSNLTAKLEKTVVKLRIDLRPTVKISTDGCPTNEESSEVFNEYDFVFSFKFEMTLL